MHNFMKKLTAALTVVFMTGINFLPVGVYAANTANQNNETSEENVQFNATIGTGYSAQADISDELNLNFSIAVSNTGYLKDATVTIENNNYQIAQTSDNEYVKAINGNVIELNEVNTGKTANIQIPIKLNKTDRVSVDEFDKDSTVTFDAVYINAKGKEKKIQKKLDEHLEWTVNATEKINQNLLRYLNYEDGKTMVSFVVNEGIENNAIPALSKEISITVPKLNNEEPESVTVTGENIDYAYSNGTLVINKTNNADEEGKVAWNSNEVYIVTYMYNTQTDSKSINTSAKAVVTTAKGAQVEGTTTENEYNVENEVGSIVEVNTYGSSSVGKGYMYTNLKREDKLNTEFEASYIINVGNKDLQDNIVVKEVNTTFNGEDENVIADATGLINNKKVVINADELVSILGEEGKIVVKDEEDKELGTLYKGLSELTVEANKLTFEITAPQTEGNLHIRTIKEINGKVQLNTSMIKSFKTMESNIEVTGSKEEEVVSRKEATKKVNLTEPESSASLDVSTKTLSTVVENKDIVINTVLNTNSINNSLYTNPNVKIVLPEEITGITITDAQLLHEDELTISSINVDRNVVNVKLSGVQSKYNASIGTLIRLVANVSLNNLAPSNDGKVICEYSNEETGEVKTLEKNIKVVAPTGFVTTNTIETNGQTATAIENDASLIEVENNSTEKQVNISGTLINNLGQDAEGVVVLGRIPFAGNKTIEGKDLKTTVDTKLSSGITVNGLENATTYYSEDGEASIESSNWTTEYTENTKSYKIVSDSKVSDKSTATFNYTVTLPANLDHGNDIKENYGVFYNNNATEGVSKALVEAKTVGATTGGEPSLALDITAVDSNTGEAIEDTVSKGQYITLTVKATNNGTAPARNTKVTTSLNYNLAMIESKEPQDMLEFGLYTSKMGENDISIDFGDLEANKYKEEKINLIVARPFMGENEEENKITLDWKLISDNFSQPITKQTTFTNTEGTFTTRLFTNVNKQVTQNKEYQYKLTILNASDSEKNNVVATFKLSNELEYAGMKSEGYTADYNKNQNTVTVNVGNVEKSKELIIKVKATKTGEATVQAELTYTGSEKDVKTNTIKTNVVGESSQGTNITTDVTATQTSNISGGTLLDTDTLEYYIDFTNNTDNNVNIIFADTLPNGLEVENCKVVVGNTVVKEMKSNDIRTAFELPGKETARVTIKTKIVIQSKGTTLTVENNPRAIIAKNGSEGEEKEIAINSLTHKITGTGTARTPGTNPNPGGDPSVANGSYTISGTAWLDANNNGKKEKNEKTIEGLELVLYNNAKGSTVKDSDNKEVVARTDSNGQYGFTGLNSGEYMVVARYDTATYGITTYRAEGLSNAENSDFVAAKLGNSEVAATDKITITNANEYNIDLGLVEKNLFDLDIEKKVVKMTVVNSKTNATREYTFDNNTAKIELSTRNIEYDTVLVEYKLRVTNAGQVAGYAKSIVDYLPAGMTFNSELNQDWYVRNDGNAYSTVLANTIINPGETKEITLVLSRKMTGENTGTTRNTAKINEYYNEYGYEDIDAESGEGQSSSADAFMLISTGKEIASYTGITLGIIAIISLAVYLAKKYVINNMYNDIL